MTRLFLFNPETDFALGCGRNYYTPPARVVELRKRLALMPAIFAKEGDFLLLLDEIPHDRIPTLEGYELTKEKNINLLTLSQLEDFASQMKEVVPWGWNPSLRRILLEKGIDPHIMPDENKINEIRRLAHRRNSIKFLEEWEKEYGLSEITLPVELFKLNDVEDFILRNEAVYLKMPWSSSGRGVVSSRQLNKKLLLEWSWGSIRSQGSVIGEIAYDRVADFASEWICRNGEASFLGLSFFITDVNGHYDRNIAGEVDEMESLIKEKSPAFSFDIIKKQKKILDNLFAPHYEGPLGIDMLADIKGVINPCVEINLRHTMGHVEIFKNRVYE